VQPRREKGVRSPRARRRSWRQCESAALSWRRLGCRGLCLNGDGTLLGAPRHS
jgi:hypothetical protein